MKESLCMVIINLMGHCISISKKAVVMPKVVKLRVKPRTLQSIDEYLRSEVKAKIYMKKDCNVPILELYSNALYKNRVALNISNKRL